MMKWKENEREIKKVVRGVYKRKKENSFPFILKGKWFSILGRVILPPRENGFTLFCQPNNVKLKIEENSFPGKRFTPYQTEPKCLDQLVFIFWEEVRRLFQLHQRSEFPAQYGLVVVYYALDTKVEFKFNRITW